MGKVQGYGQGIRVVATSVLFRINYVGYKFSDKETGCGQSARMWAKYKDVGKVQGYRQSTRICMTKTVHMIMLPYEINLTISNH